MISSMLKIPSTPAANTIMGRGQLRGETSGASNERRSELFNDHYRTHSTILRTQDSDGRIFSFNGGMIVVFPKLPPTA